MAQIPTTEPIAFIKGDTVKWTKQLDDYRPQDGWELSYAFVMNGDQQTVTASDNGNGSHLISFASATFNVGTYYWQAYASKDGERFNVATGQINVKPDFNALTDGYDARTHVKRVLDAIEAVLENRASEEQSYIMIGPTQITNIPHADLLALRSKYKSEYANELKADRISKGLSSGNTIKARF